MTTFKKLPTTAPSANPKAITAISRSVPKGPRAPVPGPDAGPAKSSSYQVSGTLARTRARTAHFRTCGAHGLPSLPSRFFAGARPDAPSPPRRSGENRGRHAENGSGEHGGAGGGTRTSGLRPIRSRKGDPQPRGAKGDLRGIARCGPSHGRICARPVEPGKAFGRSARPLAPHRDSPGVAHEHPVVVPHVTHLRQVPLRTSVNWPHSRQASPSYPLSRATREAESTATAAPP